MENNTETVEIKMSEKEILEQYLNDSDVQNKINETCIYLNDISHGNWISFDQLCKKSFYKNEKELKALLDLIVLSKKAISKLDKDKKIIYKFTLTKELRKKVLETHIKNLNEQISILQKELSLLN
jgi:hypothetical protein